MPTTAPGKLDSAFEDVTDLSENQDEAVASLARSGQEKDDDTRQTVAKLCVIGYFAGLILILIGVPIYNYFAFARADQTLLLDLKDTLLVYQAVVGTLTGAVVAYYFKTQIDKQQNQ